MSNLLTINLTGECMPCKHFMTNLFGWNTYSFCTCSFTGLVTAPSFDLAGEIVWETRFFFFLLLKKFLIKGTQNNFDGWRVERLSYSNRCWKKWPKAESTEMLTKKKNTQKMSSLLKGLKPKIFFTSLHINLLGIVVKLLLPSLL